MIVEDQGLVSQVEAAQGALLWCQGKPQVRAAPAKEPGARPLHWACIACGPSDLLTKAQAVPSMDDISQPTVPLVIASLPLFQMQTLNTPPQPALGGL